jgi:hypothetical protein
MISNIYSDAVRKIRDYVEKYATEENLEIEMRLGYLEDDEFKTNIGKHFFDNIGNQLADSESWDKIQFEKSEDHFLNGRRLTIVTEQDSKSSKAKKPNSTCIKKTKLATIDFRFEGSGFDLRVSFSKEEPSNRFAPEKATYKRKKERTSYFWKHLSFDITKVTMEENTIENHLYEIELETRKLDLTKMTSHYYVHDSLLKIKDMVEMCEPLESNPKLVFIKEKKY